MLGPLRVIRVEYKSLCCLQEDGLATIGPECLQKRGDEKVAAAGFVSGCCVGVGASCLVSEMG